MEEPQIVLKCPFQDSFKGCSKKRRFWTGEKEIPDLFLRRGFLDPVLDRRSGEGHDKSGVIIY